MAKMQKTKTLSLLEFFRKNESLSRNDCLKIGRGSNYINNTISTGTVRLGQVGEEKIFLLKSFL